MYNKIRTNKRLIGNADEMQEKLDNIGYMEFVNINDREIKLITESKDINTFLRLLIFFNRFYKSERYSNRYKKYVLSGYNSHAVNTNRSIIDIFLFAKRYCPQYANMKDLYNGLMDWWMVDGQFNQMICSTVNRRVWFWRPLGPVVINRVNSIFEDQKPITKFLIKQYIASLREIDEMETSIVFNSDQNNYTIIYAKPVAKDISGTDRRKTVKEPESFITI